MCIRDSANIMDSARLEISLGPDPLFTVINPTDEDEAIIITEFDSVAVSRSHMSLTNSTDLEMFTLEAFLGFNRDLLNDTLRFRYFSTGDGFILDDIIFEINDCSFDDDGDGIINCLDLDSDGDRCPDAIEGSLDFGRDDVNNNGIYRLVGGVDMEGVPEAVSGMSQGIGTSINIQQVSGCPRNIITNQRLMYQINQGQQN